MSCHLRRRTRTTRILSCPWSSTTLGGSSVTIFSSMLLESCNSSPFFKPPITSSSSDSRESGTTSASPAHPAPAGATAGPGAAQWTALSCNAMPSSLTGPAASEGRKPSRWPRSSRTWSSTASRRSSKVSRSRRGWTRPFSPCGCAPLAQTPWKTLPQAQCHPST